MAAAGGNLTVKVLVQVADNDAQQIGEIAVPVSFTIGRSALSGAVLGNIELDSTKVWSDVAGALRTLADKIVKL
ncbi:hypothetical protein ACWGR3_28940 [Streptomyces albidoflavus]